MSRPPDVLSAAAPTEELDVLLQGVLDRHFGAPRPIVRLERRLFAYRTSFPLEAVDVELAGGPALHLLLKDLSRQSLPEAIRRAKPAFLYDPLREIEAYQHLLAPAGLGTAVCYGAVVDAAADRYWLFLERVAGQELYQVGDVEVWRQVAAWLGRFHTRLAGAARSGADCRHLLAHNRDYYGIWPRRALAFAGKGGGRYSPVPALLERVAAGYDAVIERLLALPTAVIHGELYASNVLVQQTDSGLRVCPVDWEMAAVGPGLVDLAALGAGRWTEGQRWELAEAYREGQTAAGDAAPALEELLADLDCCRLHLALQWLGWAEDWTPPAEHRHDWLAEVAQLSERLGL
jgi:hypothetical protein